MVLFSAREAMIVIGVAITLLLFTSKFGLIRRTCNRFLSEFREALQGSQEETSHDNGDRKPDLGDYEVCCQLLGVTPSATQEEIKEAYRRKAQQHHPDKGGDPDTMRAITEAYQKLRTRR